MRRFVAVFLLAFIPPMAVLIWFSARSRSADAGAPRAGVAGSPKPGGSPPVGEALAEDARIYVYEGDRLVAEIRGRTARFTSPHWADLAGLEASAWPEKDPKGRAPEEVSIRADRARFDRSSRPGIEKSRGVLHLEGSVRVQGGASGDLAAERLDLDLDTNEIDVRGEAELRKGDSFVRGTGFRGSSTLRSYTFERGVEGRFCGTRADFDPHRAADPAKSPEDIRFAAGGPASVSPLPGEGPVTRRRVLLEGGVTMERTEEGGETKLTCRTLALDLAREEPAEPPEVQLWKRLGRMARGAGIGASPPPRIEAQMAALKPEHRMERMEARGDVVVRDPRAEIEADAVTTVSWADGSSTTTVAGPRKRILFRDRGSLDIGPIAREGGLSAPIEITCMDDARIERAPDLSSGAAGPAELKLSRWVWIRTGEEEIQADAMAVRLVPRAAAKSGELGYAPHSLEATGGVILTQPGQAGRGDRLKWDTGSDRVWLTSDTAAEVTDGKMRLRAPTIIFDNKRRTGVAMGGVTVGGEGGDRAPSSVLSIAPRPGKAAASGAWEMRCSRLDFASAGDGIGSLTAAGSVRIVSDDTTATADDLAWADDLAVLTGKPVRVVSAGDVVEANYVAIRTVTIPATDPAAPPKKYAVVTLRAVWQVVLKVKGGMGAMIGIGGVDPRAPRAAPGEPSEVRLTCRGPIHIDQQSGSFIALGGFALSGAEGRMDGELLRVAFDAATGAVAAARADGRVFLRTPDTSAAGERLTWDASRNAAGLIGPPDVRLFRNGAALHANEVVIADGGRTITFLAHHSKGSISFPDKDRPAPGRGRIKYPFGGIVPESKEPR
jgi:hypothetical protein